MIVPGRAIFYDGGMSVPGQFLQFHLLWHHISFPHQFVHAISKAAVLALPYQFAARIMTTAATEPRQLKKVQSDKAKKYLEVCQVLMQRFPTDTSGRSVEFLLDLVNNTEPGEAPPLPWISTASPADAVQVGRPRLVERLAPAVNFEARFAHR